MQTLFTGIKISAQLCLILFLSFSTFSQLDSASVDIDFQTGPDPEDTTQSADILTIDISIYDIDFMGEVIVTVYEPVSDYPILRVKKTMAEFQSESLISGDVATLTLYGIPPDEDYRIETLVRNYQGANTPIIITNYEAQ